VIVRLILCLLFLPFVITAPDTVAVGANQPAVRFGLSSRLFREVNENDARMSVKAYSKQIADSRGLVADPNPRFFSSIPELTKLLISGAVDIVALPTQEFLALEQNLVVGPLLINIINGVDYQEYVLLARFDGGINALSDLKGRRVSVLDNLQGNLADIWLDVLLGQETLAPPEAFFSSVTRPIKVSQTVLPVFFHQSDACVVTRQGFVLMGELNPQITNQLRILATSPQLVSSLTCFRAGFEPSLKENFVTAMITAHTAPAGRQLMTIFQCDRTEVRPLSRLQSSQELLATHARLRGNTDGSAPAPTPTKETGNR
jgi:ABC-type phosphate/phosphonate transport system substrate-binding protein